MIRKFYELQPGDNAGGDSALPEQEKDETEFNLPEDNILGKSPGDTLPGHIIAARYGEEIQEKIIAFRTQLDSYYLTCKALTKIQYLSSRELSLAVTAFQSARQFTGKILQERGVGKPYGATGTDPRTNQGLELELNIVIGADADANRVSAIEGLAGLREEVEGTIIDFGIFGNHVAATSWTEMVALTRVMSEIMSGKMWLGELMAELAKK